MRISGSRLRSYIDKDPRWASQLDEPCEVTGFAALAGSAVEELSPWLEFKGRMDGGVVLDVSYCHSLRELSGTAHGAVYANNSAIAKATNIKILAPDDKGKALSVAFCYNLTELTGTFPGSVDAHKSGFETLGPIVVTAPNRGGGGALFAESCPHLRRVIGTFAGSVSITFSPVIDLSECHILTAEPVGSGDTAASIALFAAGCASLDYVPPRILRMGVDADAVLRERWNAAVHDRIKKSMDQNATFSMPAPVLETLKITDPGIITPGAPLDRVP